MGSSGKQGDFDMKNELLKGKLSLVLDGIKRSTAPMPTVLRRTGKTLQFNLRKTWIASSFSQLNTTIFGPPTSRHKPRSGPLKKSISQRTSKTGKTSTRTSSISSSTSSPSLQPATVSSTRTWLKISTQKFAGLKPDASMDSKS